MELRVRGRTWDFSQKTYVMGIINVTPDSFSDGGRFFGVDAAVAHARQMADEGADILDIGGESTRPGHEPVPVAEELDRVLPVIRAVRAALAIPLSIDTRKAVVAAAAAEAGIDMINDVTGLQGDPAMARVVAESGLPACLMHWTDLPAGPGLMARIAEGLAASVRLAQQAGVERSRLVIDPGVGFGKDLEGNLQIVRELRELKVLGLPIMIGTSRKSLVGKVLGLPVDDRVEGTAATVALGIAGGANLVRVHDMRAMVRVCRMTDAVLGRGVAVANR
jgi:dihydropteroate synthase